MWTQKTPSGKIRYFERGSDGRVVSVTLPDARKSTKKLAGQLLREKLTVLGVKSTDRCITFGEMVRQYKAHLRAEFKPQTAEGAEYKFRAILRGIGKNTFLKDLTAPYVRTSLFDGSATTYNERLKHFKAALRWAYREEMIASVDFLDKLPKMRTERRRAALADKFLEADELKMLIDGMKVEKWRLLTQFLVLSGLRIGEAIALTQKDVDLDARKITVNKTYSLLTHSVSPSAKTEAGNRIVSIQDELAECIRQNNAIYPTHRKQFFPELIYEAYAKYLRENTLAITGKKLSPHALRHTHVALMAAAGIPLDIISRRLGHANSDVTRDVYMHVTERLREKDAERLREVKLL